MNLTPKVSCFLKHSQFIIVIIQQNLCLICREIPRRSGLRDHPRLYHLLGLCHYHWPLFWSCVGNWGEFQI